MRRDQIFKVTRKGRSYYVRAFDSCACMMLAEQGGVKVDKCVRASGKSKMALDMHTYSVIERHPSLRKHYKLGMTDSQVWSMIHEKWR